MLLANTATLLRAPAVLLQVGGGDGGWRCPQNPEITKEETELEAKYIPCMNTSLPPVLRPRRDADMQGQISVALWGWRSAFNWVCRGDGEQGGRLSFPQPLMGIHPGSGLLTLAQLHQSFFFWPLIWSVTHAFKGCPYILWPQLANKEHSLSLHSGRFIMSYIHILKGQLKSCKRKICFVKLFPSYNFSLSSFFANLIIQTDAGLTAWGFGGGLSKNDW